MDKIAAYFGTLADLLMATEVSLSDGASVTLSSAVDTIGARMRAVHAHGGKIMFIGNGGSAGICSHMATDYSKNGRIRSMAFNDSSALTCLGNDLGYHRVFAEQIGFHGKAGDILVAISSSGRSANILQGVEAAKASGIEVFTFSGFSADNPLRRMGHMNIFLASGEYGFVEVGHLAILHAILDVHMGWNPVKSSSSPTSGIRE